MRRRSRISASAPAGRASRNSGRVVATCTSETISGEGVSNVINQAAAESCIHVPMLETTSEIHSARNSGRRNGLHAERSEEHTSELQSPCNLVCRLLLEKKK